MMEKINDLLNEGNYSLQDFFDACDIFMCITEWTGDDFILLLPNEKVAEFFKISIKELKGKRGSDLRLPKENFNYWINIFSICNQSQDKFPIEFSFLDNEKEKWFKGTMVPLKRFSGQNPRFIITATEITEYKEMEALLSHERDLLHNLLNHIPDTIYFKDSKSQFTQINPAQASILGLNNPEEAIGKSDFDFFPYEQAKAAFEDEQRIMNTGKSLIDKLEYIKKGNGEFIWVSATKVPIVNKEGQINGIVGISRDMTVRKNAEDVIQRYTRELEELNASKDKLFSIIAHDLRSPFNGLLGFASFLAAELNNLSNEEIKTFADNIKSSVQNILTLLNNLLEWARVQIGGIEPVIESINIHYIIDNLFTLFEANAVNKRIKLINEVHEKTCVRADSNMFSSVLQNLISNAIKFTRQTGEVKISSRNNNGFVEIIVCDSGVGISEENLAKMFRIDSNLTTSGTAKEKGSGLGLILSKELIEKNHGYIRAESQVGIGSKFILTLPAAENII